MIIQSPRFVSLQGIEKDLIHCDGAFTDADPPICDRFAFVYTHFPEFNKKRIYENFDHEWAEAYKTATGQRLFAAMESTALRWNYFWLLKNKQIGMRHIVEYHIENSLSWKLKFWEKWNTLAPRRFVEISPKGKIYYPQLRKPVKLEWLH